jgi:NAD(P)-dependent dehydrogenase (short-subunit alcohol dehydrogenase family)
MRPVTGDVQRSLNDSLHRADPDSQFTSNLSDAGWAAEVEILGKAGGGHGHDFDEAERFIDDYMTLSGSVARAAEIANAIVFLASGLASFTTGAIQVVDGGVMAKAG